MTDRLIFCFPYRDVGGVPVLFLRLAEELSTRGVPCAIVDYEDGSMARRRRASTQLIAYRDDAAVELPADAILVMQAMTAWSIFPGLRIPPGMRLMFWNCHPFNLVPTLPGFRRFMQAHAGAGRAVLATILRGYRNGMRRFVQLLLEREALVFMDWTNVATTESYLNLRIDAPRMLAVAAPRASQQYVRGRSDFEGEGLRVAWVGRLVDFKYYPLKNALRQLNAIQPEIGLPIACDVIGGGEYEQRLRKDACEYRNLKVHFNGELDLAAVERHLAGNTDVLIAMGTSALEGARFGVPTILLDLSYGEVPEGYAFSWLHERDGYSLANVAGGGQPERARESLLERLRVLVREPAELSALARVYFDRHHELGAIGQRLVELAHASRCTFGDLASRRLIDRGLIYPAFCALREWIEER